MSDIRERIREVVEDLFFGNQAAAARAVGVSPAAISRILKGDLRPGSQVLSGFSNLPAVNEKWFMTGQGDPFYEEPPTGLRVSKVLLPGTVGSGDELFVGQYRPVAIEYHKVTRYWYEVPRESSISRRLGIPFSRTPQRNYLLIESERSFIARHVGQGSLVTMALGDHNVVFADLERFGDGFAAEPKVVLDTGARDGLTSGQLAEVYLAREGVTLPFEMTEESGAKDWNRELGRWIAVHPLEVSLDDIAGIPILFERHLL